MEAATLLHDIKLVDDITLVEDEAELGAVF